MSDGTSGGSLPAVAAAAAADAGNLDPALLGDFLPLLTRAVEAGQSLTPADLQDCRVLGADAAAAGVALRALLDLYLSAARRLWPTLRAVTRAGSNPVAVVTAGEVMLQALDDAVAVLAEGYQLARLRLVRAEVSARREFVDDLLSAGSNVGTLLQRAAGFGLDLTGPHAVAVVRAEQPFADDTALTGTVERAVGGSKGDSGTLIASKDGLLVAVFAAPDQAAVDQVIGALSGVLGGAGDGDRVRLQRPAAATGWQLAVGRAGSGPSAVLSSFHDAREAVHLAARLRLPAAVIQAADLLVYRVLLRDRMALLDLIAELLTPLLGARGGAEPLLETLAAYFDSGGNAAHTARVLFVSVRTVTYRLARVHRLTGHDPTRSTEQFALHAAVLGARLLQWPQESIGTLRRAPSLLD